MKQFTDTIDLRSRDRSIFSTISFVAAATSIDETRYGMCHVLVEETGDNARTLVSTDGRRLHMAENVGLEIPAGLYFPIVRTRARIVLARTKDDPTSDSSSWRQFPNYRRILRKDEPKCTRRYESALNDFNFSTNILQLAQSFPETTVFRLDYVRDLPGHDWTVSWWGPSEVLRFASGNLQALIMPMQITPSEAQHERW